jgi:hypothetical protein
MTKMTKSVAGCFPIASLIDVVHTTAMAFSVLDVGTHRVSANLGSYGTVEVHTGARINASGELVDHALLIRWNTAERSARLSQTVATRGFAMARTGRYRGIFPQPPATNVTVLNTDDNFGVVVPLSPPMGEMTWTVDALHPRRRPDPGRAYLTDESYDFVSRTARRITFFDSPTLFFDRPNMIVASQAPPNLFQSLELLARFHTYFWIREERIGIVQWICSWRSGVSAISLPHSDPTYEQVEFYTGPPSDGPTDAELRRLMGQWQREDRSLRRHR